MRQFDEKIRQAADALSKALSDGGRDGRRYDVEVSAIDITCIEDDCSKRLYRVSVREVTDREIA